MTAGRDGDLAALTERVARLEDFAGRLAGLLGAAGKVLDMAGLVEREHLHRQWQPQPAAVRARRRRAAEPADSEGDT